MMTKLRKGRGSNLQKLTQLVSSEGIDLNPGLSKVENTVSTIIHESPPHGLSTKIMRHGYGLKKTYCQGYKVHIEISIIIKV